MTSRFQLVEKAAAAPGYDIVSSSTQGPFVDTGAWVAPGVRKQRIYLSVDTIRELAEVAGVIQPAAIAPEVIERIRNEAVLDYIKEGLSGDLADVLHRLSRHLRDVPGDVEPALVGAGAEANA